MTPRKFTISFSELLKLIRYFITFGQQVKPIISKGHSKAFFWIFHQIFFLAFNSRDIIMLWVLNLFSRSSCTKLWKRILKKMSQKIFFDTQSWQVVRLPHIDSVGKIKFESEISMKTFFFEKHFYVHWMNAHIFCIIQRLWKTSKNVFQLVISTWRESP